MKKFEYLDVVIPEYELSEGNNIRTDIKKKLNFFGEVGWEVVNFHVRPNNGYGECYLVWFKREKE